MSSHTAHGYAARAVGQPLVPINYPPPDPGENDIRVEVSHCGVCHTDIQAIDDYYGITTYPLVPGHEIVGHVSAVGRKTSGLKEGDRVGIGWQGRSCGHCEWCHKGQEQLCMDIVKSATWLPYGGFSTSVLVDHRFAYTLPEAMPSELAAVLMCAGITVYSALRSFTGPSSRSIGIVGAGGLGHLAIQFAHALGHEVTAISTSANKKEQALAFGADRFLLAESGSLKEVDYCFDLLLCTATGKLNWEALLMTLKKNGRIALLGFPDVSFNSTDLVAHQLSITGSFLGTHAEKREMLSFAQAHGIRAAIEVMPMSQVNEALQRVRDNKARYRIVLAN
jgi:uncharacterized zinc-type alcohol dehydrogenase-like protein